MTRAPEELLAEAAQLAAWFHWSLGSILDLEHPDRELFLRMISGDGGEGSDVAA